MTELSGTGRHLSPTQLRAWTGFVDASRMLEAELASHLQNEHGMSHREYEVLVRLDGAGGTMRMSTLASQIVASAPLVTQTVRRLETAGWVAKQPSAEDQRGVEAVLLPAGRDALAAAAPAHAELVKTLLLDRVGPDNLASFAEAINRVAVHFRGHRHGAPLELKCDDSECPLGGLN